MRRAIELARGRLGQTGDNPAVGCVLVKGEVVLTEAVTAPSGRPHAEEQALAAAGEAARGATAYVTLEPCGERTDGTYSCAERMLAAGLARVVYAYGNPDTRSAGRGPERLRADDVAVESGVLAEEAAAVYADFMASTKKGGADGAALSRQSRTK
ncbi:MAG: deaminase [Caulobacteraceae bacterium]